MPDDSFYKDVVINVRHNLQHFLDGRLRSGPAPPQPLSDASSNSISNNCSGANRSSSSGSHSQQLSIASSGYPTLLTAEQFGEGPETQLQLPLAKVARRPHTKHSWKWKWDYVKKFTMVNEGGRLVKKLKQPFMGLRDLSRMDMWTQLTMRQKHELEQQQLQQQHQHYQQQQQEQQLQQLHLLLDRRLLPHIILEQNEQAVIKCEQHDEQQQQQLLPGTPGDELLPQTFADQSFLSLLQLQPRGCSNSSSNHQQQQQQQQMHQQQQQHCLSTTTAAAGTTTTTLVLSGEWARPRLYLCICCGAKFEQRKALEEHKTFRHSHIYATHYELVGRELLAGNLLRHLFLPKRALSRYAAEHKQQQQLQQLLQQHKLERAGHVVEDESSSNSSAATSAFAATTTTTASGSNHSAATCSTRSSISASASVTMEDNDNDNDSSDIKTSVPLMVPSCSPSLISSSSQSPASSLSSSCCTKCGRKCNGLMDLYRHMLDCSGDYVWSLAKKRKYRYYCGSKKRRTHACNKSAKHFAQLLRQKNSKKCHVKKQQQEEQDQLANNNDASEESGSNCSNSNSNSDSNKTKTPPRQRPSDGELG